MIFYSFHGSYMMCQGKLLLWGKDISHETMCGVKWVLCGPLLMLVSRWSSLFVHLTTTGYCEFDWKIFHLCWALVLIIWELIRCGLWLFVVCSMHLTTFLGCSASFLYWYYISLRVLGWGRVVRAPTLSSTTDLLLYAIYVDKNLVLRRSSFCASFARSAKVCSLFNK